MSRVLGSKQNLFGGFNGEGSLGKTFSGAEATCFSGCREFCRGSSLRRSHRFP